MFANTPKSSNSNRILDIYNPNREYLSDNDDMVNVGELNAEQRQEIAQLREEVTTAHMRTATFEERAIHKDTRSEELQSLLNEYKEKMKNLLNERNESQLLRSEEGYGYRIQARDVQIQQLKRHIRNNLSAGAVLFSLAIVLLSKN
ncbi:hypothetical protein BPAE_0072g00470 [Botrytis paeoniae]|uniref:Uncharacterized protein n=1 Tax=Botrytis paeoniae TaxID=278948 RepID=A0A4Z1FMG2_9HELO|nr:hypothetical protein BPAE_0072g00470 [Botrytis paeoniae]